ncbi:MAG: hypothetical protein QOE84_1622 [Actinomycetota bacterium]|nr:hypothetical protein [Actinomycetota bacterium]
MGPDETEMLIVAAVTDRALPPVTLARMLSRAAAAAGTAFEDTAADDVDVQVPMVVVAPAQVPAIWSQEAPTQASSLTLVVPATPPLTATL